MSYSIGDTVTLDGIESVIIYDNGSEDEWGRYIVADKNHDLIWYIEGTDCVDEAGKHLTALPALILIINTDMNGEDILFSQGIMSYLLERG